QGEGRVISKEAKKDFDKAAERFKEAEKVGWNDDNCKKVHKDFLDVADDHNNMVEAMYNAAVVLRRCGKSSESLNAFEKVLKLYPKHQPSTVYLAVFAFEKGDEGQGEGYIKQAVAAGGNTPEVAPAYVNAAILLRKRGRAGATDGFSKAQDNLRRALAIDSRNMAALTQLAMLYFDVATIQKKSSYLTLAMLVCSQGIKIDPEYGPIYHVLGQIHLQKAELVDALKAFGTAIAKDPSLFESHVNYAAINLNFRGYQEAKSSFEKAISLNPKSYDAHIGLGVALRGLEDFAGAKAEYRKAADIDPKRTDYIFNLGVLEMDYTNTGDAAGYDKAKDVFKKFLGSLASSHKVDPDGKGPLLSWQAKAEARIASCDKAKKQIAEAEKEMAEVAKLQATQKAREEEMVRKAKELEAKEAAGQQAPGEGAAPAPTAAPTPPTK
ncbi:MAG: tetratricopeptide repeat protein, partial [Myxococcota bacterium]|nr:tetratricopeptide repeat protein [Myxococcota bacterium]